MKGELWQSNQIVLSDDLNRGEGSKEEAIRERIADVFEPGVLENSQLLSEPLEFEIVQGDNNAIGNPTITINTGVGFSSLGERILLNDIVLYDSSKPTTLTSDGIGGFTLTPISTGAKNILLTQSATSYIWIGYLKTIDPAVYTLQKYTSKRLFVKASDGYEVKVNTTGINPDSSRFIRLGKVVVTNTVDTSGISYDGKQFAKTKINRVGITIDSSKKPSTYANSESKQLDDHINAIGSGTPNPSNPHGMTLANIEGTGDLNVQHQAKLHSSGIVTSNTATTASALYMDAIVYSATNDDYVIVRALSSDEEVIVNGVSISNTDIPSDVSFNFLSSGSPIAVGYYLFILNNVTKAIERQGPYASEALLPLNDVNKFPLWSIRWYNAGISYDLDNKKDWRLFGTTSRINLRTELLGALLTGTAAANRTYDMNYSGGLLTQVIVSGETGTIGGVNTIITYTYDGYGRIATVSGRVGNKVVTTTLIYVTPTDPESLIDYVTETVTNL